MSFPIALWQGPSPEGSDEAAFAALDAALRAAAALGAITLVAPEVFLPGYNQPDIPARAQPRGGPWHQRLATLARTHGCGIVIGYAERDGDSIYNSAVALGADGRELGHYRKVQLFGPREKSIYAPGDAVSTFDLHGIRAAMLICYDVEFAHLIRRLAEEGADLILVPTANPEPNTHVSRLVVPAHAINHGLTIVYANYCGPEGDITYCGASVIAAPDAAILAAAGPGPALLIADIDRQPDPALMQTQLTDYRPI
ncbi:nitrilase [Tabrizicola sp. TH137]|uniref:carbon-nitrogen hydrolase family protein n=1 Tax=Tabrizicola sp. TH137 TaxID=2067452 RepID=UPI000C7DAA0E|nr:carbon-nitrogen hydrolase family protein [Tabrizicola sp. TH137]PLL11491.1 nitrilase [Tabrizicola sp. TH137]